METVLMIPLSHLQDATFMSIVVDVEQFNRRTTDGSSADQAQPVG